MVKLYVHLPLPLGGIVNQRSSAGADLALFVTIVTHDVINVIENFEMMGNILYQFNYSSYHLSHNRAIPNFYLYPNGPKLTQLVNNVKNQKKSQSKCVITLGLHKQMT